MIINRDVDSDSFDEMETDRSYPDDGIDFRHGGWEGLKKGVDESMEDWSKLWEQRYEDDSDDDEEQDSRSRMRIVQAGLLVIVLAAIILAFMDSFKGGSAWGWRWKDCDVDEWGYSANGYEGENGLERRGVNVLHELGSRQDSSPAATMAPQRVFQIDAPVLGAGGFIFDGDNVTTSTVGAGADTDGTSGSGGCTVVLMEFSFANSFGKPFVGRLILFTSLPRRIRAG